MRSKFDQFRYEPPEPEEERPTRLRLGRFYARKSLSPAEMREALYRARHRHTWIAFVTLLVLGTSAFLFLVYQFNARYRHFRMIASGRLEIGIEHRPLSQSDLNEALLFRAESARYHQEVTLDLAQKGESLLVIRAMDGRVLGKRRVNASDLNLQNIATKHQSQFGESGNRVELIYDSDGVARLVVSHRDP